MTRTDFAAGLAHLLVFYMIFVWPLMGQWRYQRLKAALAAGDENARVRAYRRMMLQQCVMVALIMLILALGSTAPADIGLRSPSAIHLAMTIVLVVAIVISGLFFRLRGDGMVRRMLKMASGILPATPKERALFAAVSVGAGISEELEFRGFLILYLARYLPSAGPLWLVALSSGIFGFAHLFQGWRGVLATGVLGGFFALLYLHTESLVVPMIIHAAVDLRILLVVTPERLRSLGSAGPAKKSQAVIAPEQT
jgi:membrane protease YdiL (CAAX protease family)